MYESTWKSTIRHFLPPLEVPVWHIFFKKRLFQVDSCIQFYRLMQLIFSTLFKGIIRKECQSFTNHGHDKTPPTVFNPLSLWLTLPRDMGVSHTLLPPGITRAILACLWFAQSWCSGWFYVFNFIGWRNLFFQHYYRQVDYLHVIVFIFRRLCGITSWRWFVCQWHYFPCGHSLCYRLDLLCYGLNGKVRGNSSNYRIGCEKRLFAPRSQ